VNCLTEFFLAQYADGELRDAEELAAHVESCAACRKRVAALQAENQLLIRSLQGIDLWKPQQEPTQQEIPAFVPMGRMAAVLVGLAVMLRAGLGFIRDLELPPGLDWLHPWTLAGQLNWLANGFFYIFEEGSSMLTSLVNQAGLAVLSLVIIGGLIVATRRKTRATAVFSLVSLMLVFVVPGYAIDIRKAEKGRMSVNVAPDEIVDDTLVAFGESVDVRGTITGDLIAFARRVNVQGTVQGNVIGFGQTVKVTGNVDGDVFGFGQSIDATGRIGQNLWGFGQNLNLGSGIGLERDATLFGANADIDGDIGRDLTVFTGFLDVAGKVGRDLCFRGGRILVRVPSTIGRDLKTMTRSEKEVLIEPGVTVAGKKTTEIMAKPPSRYRTFGFYMRQMLRIGAAFLTGLLLFWLFPSTGRVSLSTARSLLTSGGVGFLALVATPVAAVILAITLIGLPIAIVALAFWLLCLYLAKIVIARCIGGAIVASSGGRGSTALALIAGLVVVIIAVNLPFIGGVLNFLLILIGLGALVITLHRTSGWSSKSGQAGPATV
jgi:hypothetical protein